MKKNFIIILVLLFSTVFLSGCLDILTTQEDDLIAPEKGMLEIYLTDLSEKNKADNPETYVAINLTIYKIQVHLAGEDEEDEGEWVEWILNEPTEYNLMELKDESILLSEEELTPGKYTQIRIFVTDASIDIESGEIGVPVEIPSVYQTGIKLIHPFEIIAGETIELTIDFDAEKSIIKTGNGSYKLMLVIKIVII